MRLDAIVSGQSEREIGFPARELEQTEAGGSASSPHEQHANHPQETGQAAQEPGRPDCQDNVGKARLGTRNRGPTR